MKARLFLITLAVLVGIIAAFWPARPIVSLVESQDKVVHLGNDDDGFILDNVTIPDSASVTVIRNALQTNRATLVFLHGFPDNVYSFSNQLIHFKDDFNVMAVSLRGYEPSSAKDVSGLLGVENLAKDVVAVLDFYRLKEPVHIVGHDWGSVIAQLACKAYPERFSTLTLMAVPHLKRQADAMRQTPAQLTNSWYMMFFQLPVLPEWWFSRNDFAGFEWLFRSWSNGVNPNPARIEAIKTSYRTGGPDVVAAMIGYYRQNIFAMLIKQAKKNRGWLPLTSADGPIHRKTLLLSGDRDWCMLPKIWDLSTNRSDFPAGVSFERLEGVGHFLHQENPQAINALIRQFVTA